MRLYRRHVTPEDERYIQSALKGKLLPFFRPKYVQEQQFLSRLDSAMITTLLSQLELHSLIQHPDCIVVFIE